MQVAPETAFPAASYACTEYEVIGDPFDAGSVQDTVTLPVPDATVKPVGALGAVAGVTALEADDGAEAVVDPAP